LIVKCGDERLHGTGVRQLDQRTSRVRTYALVCILKSSEERLDGKRILQLA
jgi:hypothetical protein